MYFEGLRNVGWNFAQLGGAEAPVFEFARRYLDSLEEPICAWDIGANVGLWSLFLAGHSNVSQVVCYEPDEINLRLLSLNRDRNALASRLDVRAIALSDKAGKAVFHSDAVTGSTGSLESGTRFIEQHYSAITHPVNVVVSTVDDEVQAGTAAPQFLKIDVEGHELALLRGARSTLSEHRPMLLIEVTNHVEEVAHLLTAAGYRLVNPKTRTELHSPAYMTAAIPSERWDSSIL